ncbi:dynactin p62 family-domain-containing protein [Syncephalis fuscata]|nr:dynactin p62 family-domain-containing protein [Syncephalis fuscata]
MAASTVNKPFVHYHCPCIVERATPRGNTPSSLLYTPVSRTQSKADLLASVNLERPPPAISFSAHPVSKLYFCEDCHVIKCPRCTNDDIICYYCPNCLFEVPTASVKGEKNRCMRNCFQCPSCYNTLTVTAEEQSAAGASAAGTAQPVATGYYLACSTCRWDSREVQLTFERPTGLAAQIQKIEDGRHEVREFEHLKEHFERIMRNNTTPTTGFTSIFSNLAAVSLQQMRSRSSAVTGGSDDIDEATGDPIYKSLSLTQELEDEESRQVEEAMTLTDAEQVPTLQQRHSHPSEQPFNISALQPERIHLRVKRSKRCRSCRIMIIKPDQKAMSTQFKIKMMAIHYVPNITIAQLPTLRVGETTRIVLRFANPLYFPIDVLIEQIESDEFKVLAKEFNVTEFSDVWYYDNDIGGPASATLLAARAQREQNKTDLPEGVFNQKGSSTCILVEVKPSAVTDELKFSFLVKYSFIETPESDEESEGSDTEKKEKDDVEKEGDTKGGDDKDTPKVEGELYENRFWITIGCGPVLPATS